MTTYYGVWSGEEWYCITNGAFHTPSLAVARAQALMVTGWLPQTSWKVRAIGEDGLPVPEQPPDAANDSMAKALGLRHPKPAPESHQCAMCGKLAKEWVDVRIKGWMCEQHRHVSIHGPAGLIALDQASKEAVAEFGRELEKKRP